MSNSKKTNYFQRHIQISRRVSGDTHLFSRANTYYKIIFTNIYDVQNSLKTCNIFSIDYK